MGTVTYPSEDVAGYVSQNFVPWRIPFDSASKLLRRYNVVWTPTVIFADRKATEHFRVTGYLPPEVFMAYLAFGRARVAFGSHNYPEAAELFDAVARDFPASSLAPEAIYFRAVSRRKATDDEAHLDQAAAQLAERYPESDWSLRIRPWVEE
jgi:Thioredoxin-like domain